MVPRKNPAAWRRGFPSILPFREQRAPEISFFPFFHSSSSHPFFHASHTILPAFNSSPAILRTIPILKSSMLPSAPGRTPLFPGAKVHRMSFCFFTFIRSRYPTALDNPVKLIQYLLQNISIITLRMKHDESISMLTIVRPLTLWELPGRGEQVMSDVRL